MAALGALRWFTRVVLLPTASTVKHHYFSLISAGVLSAALFVALTSSSFDDGSAHRGEAHTATGDDADIDATPMPLRAHTVVYYVVASDAQRVAILDAMQHDELYRGQNGVTWDDEPDVYFLPASTPEEEAYATRLITQLAEAAPYEGYTLEVVDLH